jgi:hypothetical protein
MLDYLQQVFRVIRHAFVDGKNDSQPFRFKSLFKAYSWDMVTVSRDLGK